LVNETRDFKSEIKVLQSIGRGLRKCADKERMILWDVVDDLRYPKGKKMIHNFTYRHWEKFRLTYYTEQEFEYDTEEINI
jgi:superfamily II DNA or RNA helicase